jgi:hypothetical protein
MRTAMVLALGMGVAVMGWHLTCAGGLLAALQVRHSARHSAVEYSDGTVPIVTVGISGGRSLAHGAFSRRPPISLYMVEARTKGCTYAAKVLALSIIQGFHFLSPVPNRNVTIRNFCSAFEALFNTLSVAR